MSKINKYIKRSVKYVQKKYVKNVIKKIIPNNILPKINIIPTDLKFKTKKNYNFNTLKIFELLFKKKITQFTFDDDLTDIPKFKFDSNKKYKPLNCNIKNLDDLIKLGESYDLKLKDEYPIDMEKLFNLIEPLKELKQTIGMKQVKNNIINQIIYFLQDLDDEKNMMHTVITGPPGVGKSLLGYLLSKIYYKMGIIKGSNSKKFINPITGEKENFKFNIVRRSDLIGEYVGHTAVKTQKVINDSLGGVLFIDEAYSLGNSEKKDIYSKECIDTINQNLTENKGNFICIIAGYKDELEKCFFNYNKGLARRFVFRYNIDSYNSSELCKILIKKINDNNWNLDSSLKEKEINSFFEKNMNNFPHYGGDVELLFLSCKIAHSLRIFGKDPKLRKNINIKDIETGFELFISHKKEKENTSIINNMYI
tara:strand:+ start:708 stop:1976 length:1269 start_codon:yes stop_codon:yes gene_type:complete